MAKIRHNLLKHYLVLDKNDTFDQEFLKSVFPPSSAIFFRDRLLLQETIFVRPKVEVFGFWQKSPLFGKKIAEYSVKTNYSADTDYLVSVKSRIFGYLVIR
jgi:hypothetical protein